MLIVPFLIWMQMRKKAFINLRGRLLNILVRGTKNRKFPRILRESKKENILFIYNKVMNSREKYLCHRFEVENDNFEWKKTLQKLNTTDFHLDFSENITVTPNMKHNQHILTKDNTPCTVLLHTQVFIIKLRIATIIMCLVTQHMILHLRRQW